VSWRQNWIILSNGVNTNRRERGSRRERAQTGGRGAQTGGSGAQTGRERGSDRREGLNQRTGEQLTCLAFFWFISTTQNKEGKRPDMNVHILRE